MWSPSFVEEKQEKDFQIIYTDTVPSGGKAWTHFLRLGYVQYLFFQRAEICSIKKVLWKQLCSGENRALDPQSSDYCAFCWFSDLGLVLNPSGPQSSHFSNGEVLELKCDSVIFQKHLPAGMVLLDQWTLLWLFAQASVLWDTFVFLWVSVKCYLKL